MFLYWKFQNGLFSIFGETTYFLTLIVKMCSLLFFELALYRDNVESDQCYSVGSRFNGVLKNGFLYIIYPFFKSISLLLYLHL